jgi:vacuolar-type H+-ATPase catalytic subunit A/Vma1
LSDDASPWLIEVVLKRFTNIVVYFDWWLMVIFDGLYSIGESEIESFLVYFKYIGIIATNSILLDEHKEDMTNKQFIQKFFDNIKDFTDNLTENILFPKKTDDERIKEEVEAIAQTEQEQVMEAQTDGSKD